MGWSDFFSKPAGAFYFNGKQLSPTELGAAIFVMVSDNSGEAVQQLLKLGGGAPAGDDLFTRIGAAPGIAQCHVVAFQCAVDCVFASSLPGVTDAVRAELRNGLLEQVARAAQAPVAKLISAAFAQYCVAFFNELSESPSDPDVVSLSLSNTGALFYNSVFAYYKNSSATPARGELEPSVIVEMMVGQWVDAVSTARMEAASTFGLRYAA